MNSPDSIAIIKRFLDALDAVISMKRIRGIQTFTREHGINRWNFNRMRKDNSWGKFQVEWLGYIVKDFDVSSTWLLTGRGKMFTKEQKEQLPAKKLQGQKVVQEHS